MKTIVLRLRAEKLANKDFFSKSDPYLVISRPVNSGGWSPVRTSETVRDDLNPVWRQFTLYETDVPRDGGQIKLEVFDDDGKHGCDSSDQSLGVACASIEELGD